MTETATSEKAPTSYKGEVIADNSGQWVSNMLRFATEQEAKWYVDDLAMRWLAVKEWRVAPSDEPVTDKIERNEAGQLVQSKVAS